MSDWKRVRRTLILLAVGGSTFGFFGSSLGIGGCSYVLNSDYESLFQTWGAEFIQDAAAAVPSFGADWDKYIADPTEDLAVQAWNRWVDAKIPDDLPSNTIVVR